MENITSRKNPKIVRLRQLVKDAAFRRAEQQYVCDGKKLLEEAIAEGAEIRSVFWKSEAEECVVPKGTEQVILPADLFDYVSPMANSPGPVFTVAYPQRDLPDAMETVLVLEDVQDPGNVGTVIRTANAFCADAVVLVGECADAYHPKTVRATMGAIFRQNVLQLTREELLELLHRQNLKLYGAILSDRAESICGKDLSRCAVAVGSEGHGLSREMIDACDGEIIIPMNPHSESLNAAVAASVLLWEMKGKRL